MFAIYRSFPLCSMSLARAMLQLTHISQILPPSLMALLLDTCML